VDRAHVHSGQSLNIPELFLVEAGDAILKLGSGLLGKRKGDDVFRGDSVSGFCAKNMDNAPCDNPGLAGTGTRNNLEVPVNTVDGILLR
jgi:hypothetical protein